MLWYCAEFASEVISAQNCMVAFVTFSSGKNLRRAVNFLFCSISEFWVKSKFFNRSCESAFIELKMAWMYLRLESAMLSSRLISKSDGKVLSFNLFHTLQHYSWVTFCALGQNFLPAQSLDLRPKFWAGKISRPKFGPNSAQKKSLSMNLSKNMFISKTRGGKLTLSSKSTTV